MTFSPIGISSPFLPIYLAYYSRGVLSMSWALGMKLGQGMEQFFTLPYLIDSFNQVVIILIALHYFYYQCYD